MSRVLVISDYHAPFQHKDALAFLKAVSKKYQTDTVVCIGDEADMAAISEYDSDPDGMSAGDELVKAISELKKLYKLFPEVQVCTSNHTSRPFRQAYKYGLPRAMIREYRDMLQAPKGWSWSDYVEVDGVIYQHGEGFSGANGATKAALANSQSTVIGHIHAFAGIQYSATPRFLLFGMNVGCLIDKDAYAFAYGKHSVAKPIISVGVVLDGVPVLVTMPMDGRGRWTGKL